MTDTAVKTSALEAGIKSLAVVGDRLNKLVADGRLDDDRDVIGEIAAAMTNVRTEVAAISRKLDVVQREAKQHEYEHDVARQQVRDAEAREARSAAGGRTTMQLMAAGCVAVCLATGFTARWWYAPVPVVAVVEQRERTAGSPVPAGAVAPVDEGVAAKPTAGEVALGGTITTPQTGGDYACAFAYGRQPGTNCPEDVRSVTGHNRSTRTVR